MRNGIRRYAFKDCRAFEFELVDLRELYLKHSDILTNLHRAGFYHIIWFQNGNLTHLVDFEPVKIKNNTILFLGKDVVHRFDENVNFEGKAILFTDIFFCKSEIDIGLLRGSILFNDLLNVSQIQIPQSPSIFEQLFRQMEAEQGKRTDTFQPDILRNYLRNLLLLAERERREQNFVEFKKDSSFDYLILFKDLLENQFRKEKYVKNYANQMHITYKKLYQVTSKILGKTPKQLIDDRVIIEAKRLLAHTNESIKEIGFGLGFKEPTNFNKYFRKHNNFTPIEFREKYK